MRVVFWKATYSILKELSAEALHSLLPVFPEPGLACGLGVAAAGRCSHLAIESVSLRFRLVKTVIGFSDAQA
jgi:hypothetical protein